MVNVAYKIVNVALELKKDKLWLKVTVWREIDKTVVREQK